MLWDGDGIRMCGLIPHYQLEDEADKVGSWNRADIPNE
jgi:hypothetical protein